MSLLVRLVAILMMCASASASVEAHRYHFAHIELTRNSTSGNIELVHQYFTSDIEQVMGTIDGKDITPLIEQNVQFFDDSGNAIAINLIGVETEIANTFVYQEIDKDSLTSNTLSVQFSTLLGKVAHQVNTLNVIDANGKSKSYTFKSVNDHHRVTLP